MSVAQITTGLRALSVQRPTARPLSARAAVAGTPLAARRAEGVREVRNAVTVEARAGGRGRGGRGRRGRDEDREPKFEERVVQVRRVTKVVKGGKQLSFRAVVIIGDQKGTVGVGTASAREVVTSVQKAVADAKRALVKLPVTKQGSIPHRIDGRAGAAKVMLRPASAGTGVIAGGATRVVLELAGIQNVFGKQLGSDSPLNNARATVQGLSELRTLKMVAEERGLPAADLLG